MPEYTVKLTAVQRRNHDIAHIAYVLRCSGCKFRAEHRDENRVHREALMTRLTIRDAAGNTRDTTAEISVREGMRRTLVVVTPVDGDAMEFEWVPV